VQTYFSPKLQRPHLPIPHFILASKVMIICSGEKPSLARVSITNLIMTGGPHVMVTAFSGEGATFSNSSVISPTWPFQVSSPWSTVRCNSVFGAARQLSNSSLKISKEGKRAAHKMVSLP